MLFSFEDLKRVLQQIKLYIDTKDVAIQKQMSDKFAALVPDVKTTLDDVLTDNTIYNLGTINGELNINMPESNAQGIRINFTVGENGVVLVLDENNAKWLDYQPEDPLLPGEQYLLGILDGMMTLQLVLGAKPNDEEEPIIDEQTVE